MVLVRGIRVRHDPAYKPREGEKVRGMVLVRGIRVRHEPPRAAMSRHEPAHS